MTGDPSWRGALGMGPRAEQVEKIDRDILAEQNGTCGRCGGPCTVAVRRWGSFLVSAPRLVRVCVDCGRPAGEVNDQEPEE